MNPALYRRLIKPTHARMVQAIKKFGKPVLLHSCGSVAAFIPDLIEIGVDALHPVQVTAKRHGHGPAEEGVRPGHHVLGWHRHASRPAARDHRRRCARRSGSGSRIWRRAAATSWGRSTTSRPRCRWKTCLAMVEAAKEFGRLLAIERQHSAFEVLR
ncbi:MAG: uroporphyrinogen decarboxylase family protein [Candidatus Moduliflexus flocculans]|nr:uroporphyrinogen decarboxylase family protein [Candidatus Moduliflexus flocculans]